MAAFVHHRSSIQRELWLSILIRITILFLPSGLLLVMCLRATDGHQLMLWMALAFQLGVCFLSFLNRRNWRQPFGPSVITLYLIALCWVWFGGDGYEDWYSHLARAILLIVPLVVFGHQTLLDSGAPAIRQSSVLADRLANRREWPADLAACRTLPEVKALRASLLLDASPALALLNHSRPEVRVAALVALEFRTDWRPGQAALVLQTAQRAEQPAIRAAAVAALANIDDREMVETVAQFLHDSSYEVRRAASESLLWDTERRWSWVCFAVRRVLADPLYQNDGALCHNGELLSTEAVDDLTAWSAEKGVLAQRAALTLGVHYGRALAEQPDELLTHRLRELLADPHTPAPVRVELGKLLQLHAELDDGLLEKMLDATNPAPVRLIAVEKVLAEHTDGPLFSLALAALRDLAHLPNREIALTTAEVLQRRLGVDLGLGLGQPLPPVHSREAADVTRRVMTWATQYDAPENVEDSQVVSSEL